jgi:hypothetical protein
MENQTSIPLSFSRLLGAELMRGKNWIKPDSLSLFSKSHVSLPTVII